MAIVKTLALTLLLLLVGAASSSAFNADIEGGIMQILKTSDAHHAPVVELLSEPMEASTTTTYMPVVFLHGMGDAGSNPGMQSLCKTASTKYPGLYSVCSNVANGISSITTVLDKQIEEFTASVRADPKLANGFTAVGLSQGNLVLRGYIERINNPPVHKFISICGPHNGVGTCPDNILYKLICPLWKIAPYAAPIAFSDYWKDVTDKSKYLSKSRWLADINNEKSAKNSTYKANLMKLKKYVLVEALNDTMVVPHVSESHGFWQWGDNTKTVQLRDTDAYKGDWLGLKTMDENKQLDMFTYVGDHLRFSSQFWDNTILPYLAD
jgi:palmitoyl-protein thioesterase